MAVVRYNVNIFSDFTIKRIDTNPVPIDDKGTYGIYFNRLNSAVSILPRVMEFLQQIQQRYKNPLFLVWILHYSNSVRCLWYQASGNSETGMGLYYCLRTGSSVLPSIFDTRLYSWRDFVCLSDYTCCASVPTTLCLSFPKRTNFGTRLGRYLMCDDFHGPLSTARGAHPIQNVLSLPWQTRCPLGLCYLSECHRILTGRQARNV